MNNAVIQENELEINLKYLQSFSGGDSAFEKDIIESSILEVDEKLQELTEVVYLNDRTRIGLLAHSIKSLCSIIGSDTLYTNFKIMEGDSASATKADLEALLLRSEALWPKIKNVLNNRLSNELFG